MSEVGESLQHVWNQAHQEKIVKGIVGFAVQDYLIKQAPRVLKHLETKVRTMTAELDARLVALEQRRGVRV